MAHDNALVEVKGLKKYFPIKAGLFRKSAGVVKAVDDVDLYIREGETLGLVGESGCGKTTLGRCLIRAVEPTEGRITYRMNGQATDIMELDRKSLRAMRQHVQMIFQDPYASLNPRMTVLELVGEPFIIHRIARGSEIEQRVKTLIESVGLEDKYLRRYPHAFSGGQRQRIGIARALALNPRFIVVDEAVSALDVSIQAQILNLLQDIQEQHHLTYLFIAHNLSVVEHISDRVAVMYLGKVVETGATEDLFAQPRHPYTEALLSAVPSTDPDADRNRILLTGEVGNAAKVPPGCPFHPRCRYAQGICSESVPPAVEITAGHTASCHFAAKLALRGVT